MITEFTIYKKLTGEIVKQGTIDESDIDKQFDAETENYILKSTGRYQYIDIKSKTIIDMPVKPHDFSVFDYVTYKWIDDNYLAITFATNKRMSLLQESDWTDTVSAQTRLTNYAEWQTYRQALRDIPSQTGYPTDIVWPTPPT